MKQIQKDNYPLSSKRSVLEVDRKFFGDLIKDMTGEDIKKNFKLRKPIEWRNFFVRNVCSSDGESGENIRLLWKKVYAGDYKWGVRDARWKAKENNWPRRGTNNVNRDRNSWIAASLLKSFQAAVRKEVENSLNVG